MSDEEAKTRHSTRRKKNIMAKNLFDPGDHRGAFALKVVNPKKGEYKREKIRVNDLDKLIEEE